MPYRSWCPRCLAALAAPTNDVERAARRAQQHAEVAGHHTQVVDLVSGRVERQIAGEPGLPLWGEAPE